MNVSRRNFNLGFLGTLVASLLPFRIRADELGDELYPGGSFTIKGRVASYPTLESYPTVLPDGPLESRSFFRLAVEKAGISQYYHVVARGKQALSVYQQLGPGSRIEIQGDLEKRSNDTYYIVLASWRRL